MKLPHVKGAVRQIWMSPRDDLSDMAAHYLGQAKASIFVAAYTPLGATVHQALLRALHRGVKVSVVIDHLPAGRTPLDAPYPYKKVSIDGGSMHQKFALIDDRRVLAGSWNFNGGRKCHNTLMLLSGPDTIKPFISEARRLRRLSPAPAQKLLGKQAALALIQDAEDANGSNSFYDQVRSRVQRRGWLTTREEAALRRALR